MANTNTPMLRKRASMPVKKAMEAAGKSIPLEHVIIGVQGQIISREKLVA